jgi:putative flippase GtrA
VLTQYAAEGDIDNLTAFYNTLIDVRNYLDLAAGNISKYVYDLMETVDQYFMLPTETGIKELNTVRDIIKNTENEHLLKNSSFWKALFTGDFTYLEQAKMSEENLLILKELFAETGNDKLEIAMRALYTSMGEGILNTVSKNLMEIANDPYYIKELNLSPKLFNADTSMFMEGTQYAKSFADPVDIFADYLIDMFTSMKDASETVRNFMEANITIEDPIKQALVEIGNAAVGDSEAVAEATEALKTLLRTTTDKELEDFMKNSAETLTTLQLYLGDPALNAAFEAILGKDWRSVVADLKEPIKYLEMVLNIVPDVANAMREARKNLSSSTSFTGLAVSGSSSMQSFIDVDSELKAFLMIFGALFGKESIMGDIMGYKALSTSFGIADMKTELDASSLSDVGSLVEFVNTYASLLIEIGMLSEDLYVSDVATGLFQKISSKDLAQNINENLISTLEGFNAFSEFQAYFYREVGGRVEGNILSRDIPFAINKITELGVNLFNFVSDVIFGQLFNLEYWTSLMGSGASVGRIGLNLSKGVQINLESALYSSSKDYADNIINIFDSILKEDTFSSLIPDFIKQSIMNVSMGTGTLGSLTGANVATVGYGIGEIADELLLDPEMVDKFISIEMESVKNISSAISDNIVKNLSGIFATLIDKYVPTALGKLNIPALSGILGIISGITSKFVGNFIARWVTETAATLGTELSVYLLGLNRNISLAQGQDFLTTEEVVKLSENILVDIVNFIGTLISASFEMISGGFDFDKFIGNISLQSVFSGTIDFISKMSEGSKKVISENILDFVSNTTPKGLTSLLNEYEAIPEGAKDQAAKLIEEQWDEIKLFAAEALFGSTAWKWLIDLLDIGIFRTAWQNVIGDIFSGLTKREDLSNDIWLGWGMGSGFVGQITNASLLDAITEYSPKQIVNTALEATVISYISSMKSLSDDLIKKDVTTLLRGAPPEITDLIGTMDIQKTIENVYDSLTEIIELPELFSRPEGDIGGEVKTIRSKMKVSKLDLWAGIQTGLLGEFESLDKLTLDQLDTQLTMMGMELTPEQRDILKDLQQSNWKSMAMFLKPGKLVEMGAEIDSELYDSATGEWKGILEKYIGVGRLTGQQVEEGNELVKEYMNQALEVVSNMGSVFNNMASSVEIIAEKWNFDAEILVKGLQSIGVVTDSIIAAVSSGAQAIEFQDRAKNTEGTAQVLNVLGAIGGWAGVIAAVLSLVAGLVQIWVDSQKITEQQLIAIRQNTVAIESLTNILDSMRLTMYGAPSGFIYGYTNPNPTKFDTASTRGVTFNIETLNISGSGDPDEIAAAVEQGLVLAAKRIR